MIDLIEQISLVKLFLFLHYIAEENQTTVYKASVNAPVQNNQI